MSPDSENGRERGRDSWAAEGRANEAEPLVAWDGSLRYRAGECWLSVEGLLPFPIWEMSRASKVAPQNRILPILSLWITHRDRVVLLYENKSPSRKWSGFLFYMPPAPGKGVPL